MEITHPAEFWHAIKAALWRVSKRPAQPECDENEPLAFGAGL
jgi:hypothetical protein